VNLFRHSTTRVERFRIFASRHLQRYELHKRTIPRVKCPCVDIFAFDTRSSYWNVPYKRVPRLQTAHWRGAGARRWIQSENLWVNFILIYFCGAAGKLRARVTVCWGSYITHRHTR